jgi:ABC-2 type transport system ATP-binding protein
MIKADQLSKKFGWKDAVSGISFTAQKGRITALLGPNGAGKTTTMRLLTGYLTPTTGKVFYNDIILNGNELEIQTELGYLPEQAPLYPEMKISEYLDYMGQMRGLHASGLKHGIDKVVEECELGSHYHQILGNLSKGFKQRVALAGTLIHNPSFIILDEPTSGLDPNQIGHIRSLIQKLGKDKTLILSTHILQEVEEICEDVLIISQGNLIHSGRVEDLNRQDSVSLWTNANESEIKAILPNSLQLEVTAEERSGCKKYLIHGKESDPRAIYNIMKKTDFEVMELAIEKKSLNSVFEELTKKGAKL